MSEKIKILFLAALPDGESRRRLDQEYREIAEKTRHSKFHDRLELVLGLAVRASELQEILLRERPQIVHFSGHGSQAEELIFEDDAGYSHPVSKQALTRLFTILNDGIQAVVLNACFSKPQAEAIAEVVGCAVGMNQAIGDKAAIAFAAAFYQAIAYGHTVQTAFELGCNELELLNIPEETTPELIFRGSRPKVPPEYVEWLRSRCGEVELMGLDLTHGSGVKLNHVYTPLTTSARTEDVADQAIGRNELASGEKREAPQLLLDLLDRKSLLVTGAPGSGKTTFCDWVTYLVCSGQMPSIDVAAPEGYQETFPKTLHGRLPIVIRLRDFWQHLPRDGIRSIGMLDVVKALEKWQEQQKFPGLDAECLKGHLDGGSTLLILDGVDEVPPVHTTDHVEWYPRQMLLTGLSDAVARWIKVGNRVLVTSRPYGLNSEQQRKLGLVDTPILDLPRPLQELLVRRWFVRLKENRELGQQTADAMIDHIYVDRGLDELATNPLLLMAMCIIYDQGKRLPHDKHSLYDKIVDTVLHKRYSEIERIEPIRSRLAAVALGMHTGETLGQQRETPEAAATKQEIDLFLQAYSGADGSTDQGLRDVLRVREDLLSQSGLLVSRGDDGSSFFHLSIQEFLAAERLFVLNRGRPDDVVKLFLDRGKFAGWRNTLAFHFGCLVAAFKTHSGVECLRDVASGIELPPLDPLQRFQQHPAWNQVIVFGDALQVLAGRKAALPDDLTGVFRRFVFQAIEQEIPVRERQMLASILGRLGDPRIERDLRVGTDLATHRGYVKIPAGGYWVGEDKRQLTISEPYWLARYPVTNSQFEMFIADGGYANQRFWSDEGWVWRTTEAVASPAHCRTARFNAPNQPVVGISYWEADAFCRWAGGFLPTEEQWEAAARGPEGFEYPWGNVWDPAICNNNKSGVGGTSAVGIFPRSRSAMGLDDMAGNVWEWSASQHDNEATDRVLRGGSWGSVAGYCRAANRFFDRPGSRSDYRGFRVAALPYSKPGQ